MKAYDQGSGSCVKVFPTCEHSVAVAVRSLELYLYII